jgi:hypothetical protein
MLTRCETSGEGWEGDECGFCAGEGEDVGGCEAGGDRSEEGVDYDQSPDGDEVGDDVAGVVIQPGE